MEVRAEEVLNFLPADVERHNAIDRTIKLVPELLAHAPRIRPRRQQMSARRWALMHEGAQAVPRCVLHFGPELDFVNPCEALKAEGNDKQSWLAVA